MRKILITGRIDKIGKHFEKRDNIDFRFINLIEKLKLSPIILPNFLSRPREFVKLIKPKAIILSSGGDINKKDERYKNEEILIKFAINKNIPLIGICRGAQRINKFFNGKLKKINNHVKKKHQIFGEIVKNKKIFVNSYHDYGIKQDTLGDNLKILAYTKDNYIECFCHNSLKILGIMWHPERNLKLSLFDTKLIKKFL